MTGEKDIFARWSARRAAVEAEDAPPQEAPTPAPAMDAEPTTEPDQADEEVLAAHGLRDPDDMAMGDDFSPFLQPQIPERLRRRALRKLWRSNPVLANLDGLNDYEDDYTDAATSVQNLKTAYQVGKGFVKQVLDPNEDAAAPDAPADPAAANDCDGHRSDLADPAPAPPADAAGQPAEQPPRQPTDQSPGPARARMRFKFD